MVVRGCGGVVQEEEAVLGGGHPETVSRGNSPK